MSLILVIYDEKWKYGGTQQAETASFQIRLVTIYLNLILFSRLKSLTVFSALVGGNALKRRFLIVRASKYAECLYNEHKKKHK